MIFFSVRIYMSLSDYLFVKLFSIKTKKKYTIIEIANLLSDEDIEKIKEFINKFI